MNGSVVRIQEVEIRNLQNVSYGKVRLEKPGDVSVSHAGILGIYGQNGSGKTAFIHAVDLLQHILDNEKFSDVAENYIMQGQDEVSLSFVFSIAKAKRYYQVKYDFSLQRNDTSTLEIEQKKPVLRVIKESIKYKYCREGEWSVWQLLMKSDVDSHSVFLPAKNVQLLVGRNKSMLDNVRVAKLLAVKQGSSFVFSSELCSLLCSDKIPQIFRDVILSLAEYGHHNLYVIGTRGWGPINLNVGLPIYFKVASDEGRLSMGAVYLHLDRPTIFPAGHFPVLEEAVKVLNIVLCQIVPGMKLEMRKLSEQMLPDGSEGVALEVLSIRGDKSIPLRYESEGIKKLVAVLNMLIATYNHSSMTLAIDELDAGIFEYLLGELLRIFNESGKGQLIFTSHNLRPLETLNKNSIVFTTTNPENRYVRLKNVKTNNNLRDMYYHEIILGGQKEVLYERTNNYAIEYALRKAGGTCE